jgi:hypothetical protein
VYLEAPTITCGRLFWATEIIVADPRPGAQHRRLTALAIRKMVRGSSLPTAKTQARGIPPAKGCHAPYATLRMLACGLARRSDAFLPVRLLTTMDCSLGQLDGSDRLNKFRGSTGVLSSSSIHRRPWAASSARRSVEPAGICRCRIGLPPTDPFSIVTPQFADRCKPPRFFHCRQDLRAHC